MIMTILVVVVCCCLFFSSVATGVLMYETTRSSNITGPDKITISVSDNLHYKTIVSMKNGDATLLMQKDGNLVSRLKDKVVWQTGVTKAGAKAVLTIFGLAITDFQEEKDYWTILRPSDSQGTTVTLNLKTDGHLELLAGTSKVWSSN